MIPVLLSKSDYPIGRLADAISCIVTECRNGSYELVLRYPTFGALHDELAEGCIIKAKANNTSSSQHFRIYKTNKSISGISTVNARHVSYDLSGIPIASLDLQGSPNQIWNAAQPLLSHGFSFESDISKSKAFTSPLPRSLRNFLGGDRNSLLSVFGGELEFDNYRIILHNKRGKDAHMRIMYGKNVIDAEQESNINDMYTHLMPYAVHKGSENNEETLITLTQNTIQLIDPDVIGHRKAYITDLSNMFEDGEEINSDNLQTHAEEFIEQNELTIPAVNMRITIDDVSQNTDSFRLAPVETIGLCDKVYVYFEKIGVKASAQIIKTEYDCLVERLISVEVGTVRTSLTKTLMKALNKS